MKIKKLNVQKTLNNLIVEILYSGATDASSFEHETVASIYAVMKNLDLEVSDEEDLKETLLGDNIHEFNFLEIFIEK